MHTVSRVDDAMLNADWRDMHFQMKEEPKLQEVEQLYTEWLTEY